MSSSIPLYVVPENALKSVVGSGNDALLEELVLKGGEHLSTLPETVPALELVSAMLGRPPLLRALKNILEGRDYRKPSAGFYVSAYELLVEHFSFGYFEHWIQVARAASWLDEVQTAAAEIGLDLDFTQLCFGGSLIDTPAGDPDDVSLGHWSSETVRSNKEQVDRYLASELCESDQDPMRHLNYPLHDTAQWLDRASQRDDGAIVAFCF